MKSRFLTLFMLLFLVACDTEPIDPDVIVSETPYLVYVMLNGNEEDQVLVPQGRAMAVNDVEVVTFQYDISLYSTDASRGFIRIEAIDVLIDGSEDYAHLVQITIMDEVGVKLLPVFNYPVTITVKVELLEPIDEAEATSQGLDLSLVNVDDAVAAYEAIVGKTITFDVSFVLIDTE